MRFSLPLLALALATTSIFATPGEVKEINHNTLVSFSSQLPKDCDYLTAPPGQVFPGSGFAPPAHSGLSADNPHLARFQAWGYVFYKDGDKQRILLIPEVSSFGYGGDSDYTAAQACKISRDTVFTRFSARNAILNDILHDNLETDGTARLAKYYVVTLQDEVTLSDGQKADTGVWVLSRKVVPQKLAKP